MEHHKRINFIQCYMLFKIIIMKTFKLTKETDPRCAEYYAKAFPNLTKEEQDALRLNWVKNNVKK